MIRSYALLLTLLVFVIAPARASVVISEIMFNPQGSDRDSIGSSYTYNREWVELYNAGTTTQNLSGWQFGDAHDNNWASEFPAGTTLGPGQSLVVTGDLDSFDANWGSGINRIQVNAFPNLANSYGTDEWAALRDSAGALQDVVKFQETDWPTANGSDGNSVFLLPNALSEAGNDSPANWR
ncbi:MAG TPA: lamin tail domain-containing protein, partial [Lacipirellula sp.]